MLWVCKRYVNDVSLAEDLMHEGFMTAMQKQDTFSGFGSFEGWLRKIMVNTSLIYLRKNKERFLVSDNEVPDNTIAPADMNATYDIKSKIINTDFTQQELLDIVDAIPEHHKIVFNMYVIDKFSHNEISKTLNITTNTSKSHLLRARKKIQELLFLKANEKEEKKDRKRLFFWWFLFFGGYIDSLFANGHSTFRETPSKPFDIDTVLQQHKLPERITSGFVFGVALQKFTIRTAMALLVLLSLFFCFFTNGNTIDDNQNKINETISPKKSGNGMSTGNQWPKDSMKSHKTENPLEAKGGMVPKANNKSVAETHSGKASKAKSETTNPINGIKTRHHKKSANEKQVVIKKIIDTVYVYE